MRQREGDSAESGGEESSFFDEYGTEDFRGTQSPIYSPVPEAHLSTPQINADQPLVKYLSSLQQLQSRCRKSSAEPSFPASEINTIIEAFLQADKNANLFERNPNHDNRNIFHYLTFAKNFQQVKAIYLKLLHKDQTKGIQALCLNQDGAGAAPHLPVEYAIYWGNFEYAKLIFKTLQEKKLEEAGKALDLYHYKHVFLKKNLHHFFKFNYLLAMDMLTNYIDFDRAQVIKHLTKVINEKYINQIEIPVFNKASLLFKLTTLRDHSLILSILKNANKEAMQELNLKHVALNQYGDTALLQFTVKFDRKINSIEVFGRLIELTDPATKNEKHGSNLLHTIFRNPGLQDASDGVKELIVKALTKINPETLDKLILEKNKSNLSPLAEVIKKFKTNRFNSLSAKVVIESIICILQVSKEVCKHSLDGDGNTLLMLVTRQHIVFRSLVPYVISESDLEAKDTTGVSARELLEINEFDLQRECVAATQLKNKKNSSIIVLTPEEYSKKINPLVDRIEERRKENERLKKEYEKKLKKIKAEMASLSRDNQKLQTENKRREEQANIAKNEIMGLTLKTQDLEREIILLTKERDNLQGECKQQSSKIKKLTADSDQLHQKINKKDVVMANMEAQSDDLRTASEGYQIQLSERQKTIEMLQREIQQYQEEEVRQSSAIEQLQVENNNLLSKIQKTTTSKKRKFDEQRSPILKEKSSKKQRLPTRAHKYGKRDSDQTELSSEAEAASQAPPLDIEDSPSRPAKPSSAGIFSYSNSYSEEDGSSVSDGVKKKSRQKFLTFNPEIKPAELEVESIRIIKGSTKKRASPKVSMKSKNTSFNQSQTKIPKLNERDRRRVGCWGEEAVYIKLKKYYISKYKVKTCDIKETTNGVVLTGSFAGAPVIVKLTWFNKEGESGNSLDMKLKITKRNKTKKRYIEIKSTMSNKKSITRISTNEWRIMCKYKKRYQLFKVYNTGKKNIRIEKRKNIYQEIIDGFHGSSIKMRL